MKAIESPPALKVDWVTPWDETGALGREGWYVGAWTGEKYLTVNMHSTIDSVPFARKIDAEAAMAALIRAGLMDAGKLAEAGKVRCREIMLNALQW